MPKKADEVHPAILRLIAERKRIGWTQLDIAEEIGKSLGAVQSFEKQGNAGIRNLERYAEAMGCRIEFKITAQTEDDDMARDKMYKRNGEKKNRGWIRNTMDDQLEVQKALLFELQQNNALRARELAIKEQELAAQNTPQGVVQLRSGTTSR